MTRLEVLLAGPEFPLLSMGSMPPPPAFRREPMNVDPTIVIRHVLCLLTGVAFGIIGGRLLGHADVKQSSQSADTTARLSKESSTVNLAPEIPGVGAKVDERLAAVSRMDVKQLDHVLAAAVEQSVKASETVDSDLRSRRQFRQIFSQWVALDRAGAIKAAAGLQDRRAAAAAWQALTGELALQDPQAAIQIVMGIESPLLRDLALQSTARAASMRDKLKALQAITILPTDLHSMARAQILARPFVKNPSQRPVDLLSDEDIVEEHSHGLMQGIWLKESPAAGLAGLLDVTRDKTYPLLRMGNVAESESFCLADYITAEAMEGLPLRCSSMSLQSLAQLAKNIPVEKWNTLLTGITAHYHAGKIPSIHATKAATAKAFHDLLLSQLTGRLYAAAALASKDTNAAAALALLSNQPPTIDTLASVRAISTHWLTAQPATAQKALVSSTAARSSTSSTNDQVSAALRRTALARLAGVEPLRYLAEVVKDASLHSDEPTRNRAIETLASTDPHAAMRWVETNMTGAQLYKGSALVVDKWLERHRSEALVYIAKQPLDRRTDSLIITLVNYDLAMKSPAAAKTNCKESFSQAMRITETASRREAMRGLRNRLAAVGGTLSREVIDQLTSEDALAVGLNQ